MSSERAVTAPTVDRRVDRAAAYSWRILIIAAAVFALVWLLGQLLVVVIPVVVALLLTRALSVPTDWMVSRGLPRALAAGATMLLFIATVALLVGAVGASIASEFEDLGSTVSSGIDDVQNWLVEDSPFDIDRERLAELREQAGSRLSDVVQSSGGTIASSAVLAVEFVAGLLLALIVTFFFLKDDRTIVRLGLRTVREDRRAELHALGRRAWSTLGGYLRGVALLGVVEAIIIGAAVWLAGGDLVAAVVVVTMLGAFVPIAGAIVSGLIAVMVTLVTAGPTAAAIVAVVALVVQQLDNDLLAPFIYGKSLQLHPLVILLSIAAGTALFGIVGALLAVPVVSVVINVIDEFRNPELARDDE
ncbi:AI-2E family transporter [Ilumatobacter nonamiensis]|uniref:AI-2E family transporter n=1 Tax=Ilumatobacter nonamiensis TaxID=467093 RepID=UPI000345E4D8|nr:AI-2E family transporter [Ilumatobacter nonamiensis]